MIERDSIEFLSQELYTDILEGDKFLADIIVKVRFKAETLFSWFISNTKAHACRFRRALFPLPSGDFESRRLPCSLLEAID